MSSTSPATSFLSVGRDLVVMQLRQQLLFALAIAASLIVVLFTFVREIDQNDDGGGATSGLFPKGHVNSDPDFVAGSNPSLATLSIIVTGASMTPTFNSVELRSTSTRSSPPLVSTTASVARATNTRQPENLLIITSVIKAEPGKLANGFPRSRFDHIERFMQTLRSIKTAIQNLPNPYIVIVEGSLNPLSAYLKSQLREAGANLVYDVRNKTYVNSTRKFLAETSVIVDFLESADFAKLRHEHNFATISKLSGRYWLVLGTYNYSRLTEHGKLSVSCKGDGSKPDEWLHTSYYIMPFRLVDLYLKDLKEGILLNETVRDGVDHALEMVQFRMFLQAREFQCYQEKKDRIGLSGDIATFDFATQNRIR